MPKLVVWQYKLRSILGAMIWHFAVLVVLMLLYQQVPSLVLAALILYNLAEIIVLEVISLGVQNCKPNTDFRFNLLFIICNIGAVLILHILALIEGYQGLQTEIVLNYWPLLAVSILGLAIINLIIFRYFKLQQRLKHKKLESETYYSFFPWFVLFLVSVGEILVPTGRLDAALSIVLTMWVFVKMTWLLGAIVKLLWMGIPRSININQVKERLKELTGSPFVYNLSLWRVERKKANQYSLCCQIGVRDLDYQSLIKLQNKVDKVLWEEFKIVETDIDYQV